MPARTTTACNVGLIVNPVAGMGGRVGLRGTDGPEALAEARRRGAVPVSGERARRAVERMAAGRPNLRLVTAPGNLGERVAMDLGVAHDVVQLRPFLSAEDTRYAVSAMLERGVDLILFAGGDGTARDVFAEVGSDAPILGVPSGVKMHSAVFATTPENAGDVAGRFLAGRAAIDQLRDAEVMDADPDQTGRGRLAARLYGYARVPYERSRVQHAKAGGAADADLALDALCQEIAASLEAGVSYVFGPGTTTQRILAYAGMEGTLLGVDVVRDGAVIGRDAAEDDIVEMTSDHPVRIVVSILGGQGFLFGRGNQQIGPSVIRRAGRDGLVVASSVSKLLALDGASLFVDTGDPTLDAELRGYIKVQTAPDQIVICKVEA